MKERICRAVGTITAGVLFRIAGEYVWDHDIPTASFLTFLALFCLFGSVYMDWE